MNERLQTNGMIALAPELRICITAGCVGPRGPELIVNSHIDYNRAVSQVLKEKLLLERGSTATGSGMIRIS